MEIENPGGDLEPPETLGSAGRELWQRVTKSAHWLWGGVDNTLLEIVCEQLDERAELRKKLAHTGDRLDRSGLRALESQIVANLSQLGFTPSDRARLGLIQAAQTEKALKFEEMRRRAEELRR